MRKITNLLITKRRLQRRGICSFCNFNTCT